MSTSSMSLALSHILADSKEHHFRLRIRIPVSSEFITIELTRAILYLTGLFFLQEVDKAS